MSITPTAEQEAILAAFNDGKDLVIRAGAGTGKTTTLRLLATSTDRRGTYTTFMRAPIDEAARTMPATLRCKTAHALAWHALGRQYATRMPSPNNQGPSWAETIDFLNTRPVTLRAYDGSMRTLSAYQMARLVLDTVKTYCQTADTDLGRQHVPLVPGLDRPSAAGQRQPGRNHQTLVDHVLPRAQSAWADIVQVDGFLRYDHAYYLKLWALTDPKLEGDYLMFDEAQDASGVMAGVMNRQDHLQRVFVGDDSQAIMGFAGAHNAMADFARQPDVQVLSLTESFRFGPTIATAANSLLDVLAAPLRIVGTDRVVSTIAALDLPGGPQANAVLCRTNAGALDEVLRLQQAGRRVCLLGNSDELRRFVEAARDLQTTGRTNHPLLMAFETWAQVEEYVREDPSGADLTTLVDLVDRYGVEPLLTALRKCVREPAADVVVSTAHKAKGREWDRVRVSADFTLSDELPPEALEAELMLAYVALTRAKRVLDPGLLTDWVTVDNPVETDADPDSDDAEPATAQGEATQVTPAEAEPPVEVPADQDVPDRFVPVGEDTYQRLVAAATTWGGTPEAFAARLLDGALAALDPTGR